MKRIWTRRDEEGGEDGRCVSILLLYIYIIIIGRTRGDEKLRGEEVWL